MKISLHKSFTLLLLSAQLLVVTWLGAVQLPHYWQQKWVQDDAYISFRYAKNLVEGEGLVYNPGELVEGYTNFLWTLISTIPLVSGEQDPLPFMWVVGLFLWIGSIILLVWIGSMLWREGVWAGPLLLIPLFFNYSYNLWFFSGMEQPLVTFLMLLSVAFFCRDPEKHPLTLFWSGVSGTLLLLTRPDTIFFLFGLSLSGLIVYRQQIFRQLKWFRYVMFPLLPLFLIWLPYTLWRIQYYGSFFPNTYFAKVAYLTYYTRGWDYLTTFFDVYKLWWFLPLPILGALLAMGQAVKDRLLWICLLGPGLCFFYVVRLGGDFMEWRFVAPLLALLIPGIVLGAYQLVDGLFVGIIRRLQTRRGFSSQGMLIQLLDGVRRVTGIATIAGMVYCLSTIQFSATQRAQGMVFPGQESIPLLSRYCDSEQYNWRNAGKQFDAVLPKDVRIATTSAGIIPFYCDRPCLDLCGLTDPIIAREPVDPQNRGRVGHEHWLKDFNVMRSRGVDIYLNWVDPKNYAIAEATPPQENFELVSMRLPDGRFTEFIILNHERVDTEVLRKDPRLVFYQETKVVASDQPIQMVSKVVGMRLLGCLDLMDAASEIKHQFRVIFPPGVQPFHDYHRKILPYGAPFQTVVVEDEGRRLPHGAEWIVNGIQPGKALIMLVRHDGTGGGKYPLFVNDQRMDSTLDFPAGPVAWDEVLYKIPPDFLKEGTNKIRLDTPLNAPLNSELYRIWFYQ